MEDSFYKLDVANANTLIVSFAGRARSYGGIPRFEFLNFLNAHFKNVSKYFFMDKNVHAYHSGIVGISKNIDETVLYLKEIIALYENVIFLGVSSGGYAAILFGSLLKVKTVVAFIPQTIRHQPNNIEEKYRDISSYINNTTNYFLYGDKSVSNINDAHHISHCERISHHLNVFLTKKDKLDLKKMRDNGELYDILSHII
jgi:hypothetical protein